MGAHRRDAAQPLVAQGARRGLGVYRGVPEDLANRLRRAEGRRSPRLRTRLPQNLVGVLPLLRRRTRRDRIACRQAQLLDATPWRIASRRTTPRCVLRIVLELLGLEDRLEAAVVLLGERRATPRASASRRSPRLFSSAPVGAGPGRYPPMSASRPTRARTSIQNFGSSAPSAQRTGRPSFAVRGVRGDARR